MELQNCWEFKKCGREPGGAMVREMGVCPAAESREANGINGGRNAGRLCWAVSGTFCGGKVQGTFAQKRLNCMTCEFFERVRGQAGQTFRLMMPGQAYQPAQQ